ncbi:MAG: hypothetical protein GYA24_18335 [Candidatus Lokiarchaeota archaeon]|nr:hypothetical protein [Candidatus Lokiarchaeota archaeon]
MIIVIGHKQSPLVKYIIDRDDVPVNWICGNLLDFQVHHADPSKETTYHIEFTNILEQKARNYIESLAIFETLGKFLDFYNPLKLSTLNYLMTRYITSINPSFKGLLATWQEAVKTIFGGETILPLFEESRVLHIKMDGIEIPVRQFIIAHEADQREENGGPDKLQRKPGDAVSLKEDGFTGIIDINDLKGFKVCAD